MEKNCEKPELTPEELEALKKRHIRSFVMRRGHISAAQKRALDESLPQYQIEYAPELLDADKAFGRHAPLVLEIGCGMGETTAAIAQAHPEVNFLGCEVFVAGVGALAIFTFINSWNDYFMQLIMLSSTKNLTIVRHDAVEIVRDMIAENSLDGVHIYFPDPWRKARHHKRRLVAQPFIGLLASRIRPGGYIHCATDWENYSEQMLEVLEGEPLLENLHGAGNFSPVMGNPLCERPRTKFQARGERLGYGIWDLVYIRKQPAPSAS